MVQMAGASPLAQGTDHPEAIAAITEFGCQRAYQRSRPVSWSRIAGNCEEASYLRTGSISPIRTARGYGPDDPIGEGQSQPKCSLDPSLLRDRPPGRAADPSMGECPQGVGQLTHEPACEMDAIPYIVAVNIWPSVHANHRHSIDRRA